MKECLFSYLKQTLRYTYNESVIFAIDRLRGYYAHLCCSLFYLGVMVQVCLFIFIYIDIYTCTQYNAITGGENFQSIISDFEGNLLKKLTGTDGILPLNRG